MEYVDSRKYVTLRFSDRRLPGGKLEITIKERGRLAYANGQRIDRDQAIALLRARLREWAGGEIVGG